MRFYIVIFFVIFLIINYELFSQADYEMGVSNYTKVNANTIEFDVFIISTGGDILVTAYQCALSFNQSIVNNGTLEFSFIPGTSQLINLPPLSVNSVLNKNGAYFLTFASVIPLNQEIITSSEKRIGRFRLTNSKPFNGEIHNIIWSVIKNTETILTGTEFSEITNRLKHNNLSGTAAFPFSLSIENDWNLFSIPGYHPENQNVNTWWENSNTMPEIFNSNHLPVAHLEPGKGYWIKHAGYRTYNTGDEWPAEGFLYSPNSPIKALTGWNYFGVYNYDLSAGTINTTPEGLQNGFIFKFNPGSGYSPAEILTPGSGYLIFLSGPGKINLRDSGFTETSKITSYLSNDWGRIIITDKKNNNYTLYAVEGGTNLNQYNLPPVPPQGVFDVRYSSGKFVEDFNAGIHTIEMNGVEYPINVRVENINIKFQDELGNIIRFSFGDEKELTSVVNNKLSVSSDIIPDEYELKQNYPNPFNPATTISFSIPVELNNVKLTIFNALGEKITELVNSALPPGQYNYKWDANDSASGLYIYELKAESVSGRYISTKKMILLK